MKDTTMTRPRYFTFLALFPILSMSVGCDEGLNPEEANTLWKSHSIPSYGLTYTYQSSGDRIFGSPRSASGQEEIVVVCSDEQSGMKRVDVVLEHLIEKSNETNCEFDATFHSEFGYPLDYTIECDNYIFNHSYETFSLNKFYIIDAACDS